MDLPSPTLEVPLKDLLYKPLKILRRYNFTGFYLVYNTMSGSYHFGTAKNVGIKLVGEFNLRR
ncbi:MAG: hypothetical protein ACFE8J_08825 [Candidatus Heimdallarchaeota archaeon]